MGEGRLEKTGRPWDSEYILATPGPQEAPVTRWILGLSGIPGELGAPTSPCAEGGEESGARGSFWQFILEPH